MVEQTYWSGVIDALSLDLNCYQLHGLITGYLSGNGDTTPAQWTLVLLDQVIDDSALNQFMSDVAQSLSSDDFSFELLLANEDASPSEIAEALVAWVQSFLSGFGLAGVDAKKASLSNIKEALVDLTAIGQLDVSQIEDNNHEENRLMEVTEYVRTLAMLIYTELNGSTSLPSR